MVRVRLSVPYRVHSRQMLCIGGSQVGAEGYAGLGGAGRGSGMRGVQRRVAAAAPMLPLGPVDAGALR
jgi:hypothetical protein